jgi:DNA-directed RNA polymerase subunit beta'
LIPAGTGLAYHEARKRAAIAALTPSTPSAQVAAAEALFSEPAQILESVAETVVLETPAE